MSDEKEETTYEKETFLKIAKHWFAVDSAYFAMPKK